MEHYCCHTSSFNKAPEDVWALVKFWGYNVSDVAVVCIYMHDVVWVFFGLFVAVPVR